MEYSLKNDEKIRLYLKEFIPIPEICNKIIKIKNSKESEDTLKYHIDRWESIAGEHHFTRDTHYGKFSYIFDDSNYVVKRDHRIYFYQMTGIPYQIVELIHELIRILNENSYDEDFEITPHTDYFGNITVSLLYLNKSNTKILFVGKLL